MQFKPFNLKEECLFYTQEEAEHYRQGLPSTLEALLKTNKIPLLSQTGKSCVELIMFGYRKAGWSAQGASKWTLRHFSEKPKSIQIKTYLLDTYSLKHCPKCDLVLHKNNFHCNKSELTNTSFHCKTCTSEYRKNEVNTRYYNALYRARLKQATMGELFAEEIKKIYENCPPGFHVDHIVPLSHESICGLHVPWNLQYLPALENIQKSNKFLVG